MFVQEISLIEPQNGFLFSVAVRAFSVSHRAAANARGVAWANSTDLRGILIACGAANCFVARLVKPSIRGSNTGRRVGIRAEKKRPQVRREMKMGKTSSVGSQELLA
jgi:hypothetical protein